MENKIKTNLAFVKATAKKVVEQIKSNEQYANLSLDDIEKLDLGIEQTEVSKNVQEAIKTLVIATLYLDKCGVKHMTERLRPGYIGMEVKNSNSVSYQTVRGQPYGTIVSIPSNDGLSVIGMSYFDKTEQFATPIVGEYMALKRAIERKEAGETGADKKWIKNSAKAQIEHFYKRSLAYWNPDKYSQRGTEPVKYENFDKIHENQLYILGADKVRDMATKPARKVIATFNYKGEIKNYKDFIALKDVKKNDYWVYTGKGEIAIEHTDTHPMRNGVGIKVQTSDWIYFDGTVWSYVPKEGTK